MGCGWGVDGAWMGCGWGVGGVWVGRRWGVDGVWVGHGWGVGGAWMGPRWGVDRAWVGRGWGKGPGQELGHRRPGCVQTWLRRQQGPRGYLTFCWSWDTAGKKAGGERAALARRWLAAGGDVRAEHSVG